ncbi:glucose 1-dehydrogenase [Pleurocapsales cyanobacterium LEGE 06147]|nr:glucose 1-dehydrogenase [Pleurocapsales cyanobacterium LEGE 06147]
MTDKLRRRILTTGVVSAAGLVSAFASSRAISNTQTPPAPQTTTNPNGKFAGKVVLITGATSGIGEGTAYAFAREGAKVFFCGRRENLGRQVEAKIKEFGGEATYMKADVRQEEEVKAFVKACVGKYGRIDIAFNNAGIESPPKMIAEMTLEDWQNVVMTNQTGVFLSMKYEIPIMLQQGGGVIVNNASVGGHRGFARIGPYGASKAAVLQLTRIAALEYTDKNIRINSISPGAVDTPMLHRAVSSWGMKPEEAAAPYPIKRLATTEEMARSVMWLSSEDASVVTGMDMDVTGGYLTR